MFCKKCGKELKDGAKFCAYCGDQVTIPEALVQVEENASTPEPGHIDAGKSFRKLLPLMICCILVIAVLLTVLGYILKMRHLDESRESAGTPMEQEPVTGPEAEPKQEAEPEQEPEREEEIPAEEPMEAKEEGIHTYELIVEDVTWTQAYAECLARGGHLVRINSEEEYQAILRQISREEKSNIKFWIGGRRASVDSYEYHWVYEDGTYGDEILNEDEKYTSYWLTGEPTYQDEAVGSLEVCMNMFYMSTEDRWVWNDVPDDLIAVVDYYSGTVGYICEYEGQAW